MTEILGVQQLAPTLVAIAPALADDAEFPVQIHRLREGIVAAYSPAQTTRASVWAMLTQLFGPLLDVSIEVA